MIIRENQLNKVLSANSKFLGILIFGPNEGLIRSQIKKFKREYCENNNYENINLSGKDLDNDANILDNYINTVSMFFKGKMIVVDNIKEKHFELIEPAINSSPEEVLLIVKSENLNKSSKIRKLFENSKTCYSLACYDDDIKSHMSNIDEFIKENNLIIDKDVKNYLLKYLSNDRMINYQELEKIVLFNKGSGKEIILEDIKDLLNDTSSSNLSKMSEAVMYGNPSRSSLIISKLLVEGASPISIIRSLMNYMSRIKQTKIEMKKGNNFEEAIRSLRPPVFWKDKNNFQRHCMQWPLQSIDKNLSQLVETEVYCKLNSKLSRQSCEKSILQIANNGKQYFKN